MEVVAKPKICRKCGLEFLPISLMQVICKDCIDKLPKCWACGAVVSAEHGKKETSLTPVGKYKLCGSCYSDVHNKGYLHIAEGCFLLLNGDYRELTEKEKKTFGL